MAAEINMIAKLVMQEIFVSWFCMATKLRAGGFY